MNTRTQYFATCEDVAAVKTLYKSLAMRWHPDRPGGNTQIMQEINAEYKVALSRRHGEEHVDDAGKTHTYYYKEANEQAVMDKLAEVIKSGILNNPAVELWLIGTWLWVKGDTKPHKEQLGRNGLAFNWNQSRQCWQWHLPTAYRHSSPDGFESIAARYGGSRINHKPQVFEE
jgi:hypothetical protein